MLTALLALGGAFSASAATVLFSDNFNSANNADINADISRQTGTLAPASYVSGYLPAWAIEGNSLKYVDGNFGRVSPGINFTSANNYSISVDYKPGTNAESWSNFIIGGATDEWHFTLTGIEIFLRTNGTSDIYGDVRSQDNGNVVPGSGFSNSTPDANGYFNLRFDISTAGANILTGNATFSVYINNGLIATGTTTTPLTQNYISLAENGAGARYWDNLQVTTVPEPSTMVLFGVAAGVVLLRFRRRRN